MSNFELKFVPYQWIFKDKKVFVPKYSFIPNEKFVYLYFIREMLYLLALYTKQVHYPRTGPPRWHVEADMRV